MKAAVNVPELTKSYLSSVVPGQMLQYSALKTEHKNLRLRLQSI